ncbi:hypothetical protein BGZ88_000201 [Linnemannia elongata]|nr:hypothetical protein BGZ88_000201 [Linnemannia elongata]
MDILASGRIQPEILDAHKASYTKIQLRTSYCTPTTLFSIPCQYSTLNLQIPILAMDSTSSSYTVSELRLLLIIILLRQHFSRSRQAHNGVSNKDHINCQEIRSKNLTLLGVESNQVCGHQTGILAHTPQLLMMTYGRTINVKDFITVAQ